MRSTRPLKCSHRSFAKSGEVVSFGPHIAFGHGGPRFLAWDAGVEEEFEKIEDARANREAFSLFEMHHGARGTSDCVRRAQEQIVVREEDGEEPLDEIEMSL